MEAIATIVILVLIVLVIMFIFGSKKRTKNPSSVVVYSLPLTGGAEVPPNSSQARGSIFASYNKNNRTLNYDVRVNSIVPSGAHFHLGDVDVAGPIIRAINLIPWGNAYRSVGVWNLTPTEANNLLANRIYVNVHSAEYPDGEIRAQLRPFN